MKTNIEHLIPTHRVNTVLNPIAQASGMPNQSYTNETYFTLERDAVFSNTWICIGFASDLISAGFVKPIDFMGLPLLAVKDKQGEINVYHNVCSHRGMKLVSQAGEIQGVIKCPYHSWTYELNGNLRGTPHVGGIGIHKDERFACEKHGLKAIRSYIWMDMIFINLSSDAPTFEEHIAPLMIRWEQFLGTDWQLQLRQSKTDCQLEITVNCNWKLAVENYCEAYHLPWVHPSLNSYSKLEDHYNILFDEKFAGQGSYAYNLSDVAGTQLPKFASWPSDRLKNAEYVALFPNVLLGIQADHVFAMMIEPISAKQSIEHLRLFYVGDEALTEPYAASRKATLESWRVVFNEDIGVVEGMQLGRESPGFTGGVFSPEMDVPTHFFQKWLANQVKTAFNIL